jgi:hypothetical protein
MHKRDQDAASLASTAESTVGWDASGALKLLYALTLFLYCALMMCLYALVCCSGYYGNDASSYGTAEAGAELGYYDANGEYVYYSTEGSAHDGGYDGYDYSTSAGYG